MVVPVAVVLLAVAKRRPQRRFREGKPEFARHDADDRELLAVEGNLSSEDGGIAAELRLPQPVTQERRARGTGPIVRRREQPADGRPHTQRRQKVVRQRGAFDPNRIADANQRRQLKMVHARALERCARLDPIAVIRRRELVAVLGRLFPQPYETIRIRKRKRPQQYEIGHREGRSRCPDAESDDEHSRDGEPGRPPEHPRRIGDVLSEHVTMDRDPSLDHVTDGARPQRRNAKWR